ncbi:hypothetical protein EVAR_60019_1 [Eumeta japonica]|uniref:Reverse transcriptase/retrotransposon-derived protein RNase H-like domain-containing protein n=1 Tax=Eumeta variegata TaxID=151549 RepID=A0A4C1ZLR1_EUMVA|nr:hypothetical protein EVAR_60019_1 [Eumeta japonica]
MNLKAEINKLLVVWSVAASGAADSQSAEPGGLRSTEGAAICTESTIACPLPLVLRTRVEHELECLQREGVIYKVGRSNYGTPSMPVIKSNDAQWVWNDDCDIAFNKINREFSSVSTLVHNDPELPLILSMDSSAYGLGAVLAQRAADGRERPRRHRTSSPRVLCVPRAAAHAAGAATFVAVAHRTVFVHIQKHCTTAQEPPVVLLGRKLRGCLDLLRPNTGELVRECQLIDEQRRHTRVRNFTSRDTVSVRDCSRHDQKWAEGAAKEQVGEEIQSYASPIENPYEEDAAPSSPAAESRV